MKDPKNFRQFTRLSNQEKAAWIKRNLSDSDRDKPAGIIADNQIDLMVYYENVNGIIHVVKIEKLTDVIKRARQWNFKQNLLLRLN